jgi:hypothetical protein
MESSVATPTALPRPSHLQSSLANINTQMAPDSQTQGQPNKGYKKLTHEQTEKLEIIYKKDPYPTREKKTEHSRDLGLELHTVSVGSQGRFYCSFAYD